MVIKFYGYVCNGLQNQTFTKQQSEARINVIWLYVNTGITFLQMYITQKTYKEYIFFSENKTRISNDKCCGLFLFSIIRDERWLFVLLILVELLTIKY